MIETLGEVATAADAKVASMLATSDEAPLRKAAAAVSTPAHVERVIGLARRLGGAKADAYLSHPFRVGTILLALDPRELSFTIGTLHNVYEVGGANEAMLEREGISPSASRAIRLLTIDRARENDVPYLEEFYGRIEEAGLALVRTIDKLDNVLGLELLEEGAIKTSYIDLAEQFVGPMATRISPELGAYFAGAIAHARKTFSSAAKLARYRTFIGAP